MLVRYEREMIAPIKACLAGLWADSVVVEELGVGYGVADVVAARPCNGSIRQRLRQRQTTPLPRRADVQVVRVLRQLEEATFDLLVERTGISARRLKYDVLRFLLAENFIERIADDTFKLLGEYRPVAEEIWAVEAKMKNWFEGLCQAKRYQHFAHKTYLAIAAQNRDRVRDEILRAQNVGLIAVSHDAAEIVFHPHRRSPRSEELFLMINERIWQQIHATA